NATLRSEPCGHHEAITVCKPRPVPRSPTASIFADLCASRLQLHARVALPTFARLSSNKSATFAPRVPRHETRGRRRTTNLPRASPTTRRLPASNDLDNAAHGISTASRSPGTLNAQFARRPTWYSELSA